MENKKRRRVEGVRFQPSHKLPKTLILRLDMSVFVSELVEPGNHFPAKLHAGEVLSKVVTNGNR